MINKERLLSTFLDYVQIDSESTHEGAMATRVAEDLKAIGCQVYVDNSGEQTGSETGNLYCTLPGTAEGEPILFAAHMDTVVPGVGVKPVIEDGVIRSSGDTVLGGDDKSGVAAIVEALRTIVDYRGSVHRLRGGGPAWLPPHGLQPRHRQEGRRIGQQRRRREDHHRRPRPV